MPARVSRSRRVKVQSGQKAIAPRVDDPHGFAIENRSGEAVTVSFRYDADLHLQTVVLEPPRPSSRVGGEPQELPV